MSDMIRESLRVEDVPADVDADVVADVEEVEGRDAEFAVAQLCGICCEDCGCGGFEGEADAAAADAYEEEGAAAEIWICEFVAIGGGSRVLRTIHHQGPQKTKGRRESHPSQLEIYLFDGAVAQAFVESRAVVVDYQDCGGLADEAVEHADEGAFAVGGLFEHGHLDSMLNVWKVFGGWCELDVPKSSPASRQWRYVSSFR